MFVGLVVHQTGSLAIASAGAASVAEVKTTIGSWLITNKNISDIGYEAYVIDRDTHQVVSFAEKALPKVAWTDTPAES